jgi:hypothetical protein
MQETGQLYAPAALPQEPLAIHWIGRWVSPGAGLDAV